MKSNNTKRLIALVTFALIVVLSAACGKTKVPDVTLAEVKAGEAVLTETEGRYSYAVDYEVDKLTITATTTDSAATVEGTGEKALVVGKNDIKLTVKNGKENKEYFVEITRKAADLSIGAIKIGEDTLTAGVDGVYVYKVSNIVTEVNLSATAAKSYATVEGTGTKTLVPGENTFIVTVKVDADTRKEYTVKITRATSDLTLKSVKIGDDALVAEGKIYKYNVANDITEVIIAAEANNAGAVVSGTGLKQNLAVGDNRFEIKVSVGEEQEIYNVIVIRAKSNVKTIASIKVDGTDAAYDAETAIYEATIDKYTANVVITLTSATSSYAFDEQIGTLQEGENSFIVTVTAEDGTTADYTLLLNVVLPNFNVEYIGDIEGAIANEDYSFKYMQKQTINIVLAEAYTQSYENLKVTYKVGNAEAESVTLDDNHGFYIPAEEAIGNIKVTVTGIAKNTYKITYHRDGSVAEETVEYGNNAVNAAITPNTDTKEVFNGYTYSHLENWVTEDGGIEVARLTDIKANVDVYYRDDIIVLTDVVYYNSNDGYKTAVSLNKYIKANANGSIEFKVLVKSTAIDGRDAESGKTSFIIYEKTTWTAGEMGIGVEADEIGKWFTVKANADMVRVYKPNGTLAREMKFNEYNAETISFVIHADAAIAAINPEIPELCTITYLNDDTELYKEKVAKGASANYTYVKPTENMEDGYTRLYNGTKWVDFEGNEVDLTTVNANVTVTYKPAEVLVYKNVPKFDYNIEGYKSIMWLNKYVEPDDNGVLKFKVRAYAIASESPSAVFNIYEYTGWYEGVIGCGQWVDGGDIGKTWYTVEFNSNTGILKIYDANGNADADHTKIFTRKNVREIGIVINGESVDIAAINPAARTPFGNNVGEVFEDSEPDTTIATPELYEKVMMRISFHDEVFASVNVSEYTEIRFQTKYQKNWYCVTGKWDAPSFNYTDWVEWVLKKSGDSWTLNIWTRGKVYIEESGLTGDTLQQLITSKYPNMISGGIGEQDDYVWTTELRAN